MAVDAHLKDEIRRNARAAPRADVIVAAGLVAAAASQ